MRPTRSDHSLRPRPRPASARPVSRGCTRGQVEPIQPGCVDESLDDLNVALGPNGANENGALTDLLEVTADNFGGLTFRPNSLQWQIWR